MKAFSIVLIIAYLMLPSISFGHPCEDISLDLEYGSAAVAQSDDCPVNFDSDHCETTFCCAAHLPVSSIAPLYPGSTGTQPSVELLLVLPRVSDRIFVPPQNRPESTLRS